jgi:hypothetical protein
MEYLSCTKAYFPRFLCEKIFVNGAKQFVYARGNKSCKKSGSFEYGVLFV